MASGLAPASRMASSIRFPSYGTFSRYRTALPSDRYSLLCPDEMDMPGPVGIKSENSSIHSSISDVLVLQPAAGSIIFRLYPDGFFTGRSTLPSAIVTGLPCERESRPPFPSRAGSIPAFLACSGIGTPPLSQTGPADMASLARFFMLADSIALSSCVPISSPKPSLRRRFLNATAILSHRERSVPFSAIHARYSSVAVRISYPFRADIRTMSPRILSPQAEKTSSRKASMCLRPASFLSP